MWVGWGRRVGGGGGVVGWRGMVGGGGGVRGLSLVGDVGDVAVVVIGGEFDDLGSAVGKSHAVGSGGDVTVAGLGVGVVVARVGVPDGVAEVEGHSWLLVGRVRSVVDGRRVGTGDGGGQSREGAHQEDQLQEGTGNSELILNHMTNITDFDEESWHIKRKDSSILLIE